MELVVLNVAFPFAPVGPDVLGDAERLVRQLDLALTEAGHDSFVMACEGSVTEGILLATPRALEIRDAAERHRIHEQYRFTLQTFLEKWPIDLIHMHGGDFYEYLPPPGVPVLVTLHLPVDQYPEWIFQIDRPQTFFQCVSAHQRRACPPCANLLPELEDGILCGSVEARHAAHSLDGDVRAGGGGLFSSPKAVAKYVSIYERLVAEARATESLAPEYAEKQEAVHA
jgi:hypothetical protein